MKSRLIIKLGTNLITKKDGSVNLKLIKDIVAQISRLHRKNHEILIVTSGAVGSGRGELKLRKESKRIPFRQGLAAVGQAILMNTYREFFKPHQIIIAQILLTNLDFTIRGNFLNTKNILELLLKHKAIPIINENDVTAYAEIKFGDNDMLSAKLASMVGADLLIILTDVAGLYTKNPNLFKDAELIKIVSKIDSKISRMASGAITKTSLGGMKSKIAAAKYATAAGVPVMVASGHAENIILKVLEGKENVGTYFAPMGHIREYRKKWLQTQIVKKAHLIIDHGAEQALLKKGGSLLASGIKKIFGAFERGDVVNIYNLEEEIIGFGQVNYGSEDVEKIKGCHSRNIHDILGFSFEEEVIHRDNLIILDHKK